jgi:hypothetical protein
LEFNLSARELPELGFYTIDPRASGNRGNASSPHSISLSLSLFSSKNKLFYYIRLYFTVFLLARSNTRDIPFSNID